MSHHADPDHRHYSVWLRIHRLRAGLTQEEAADRIGISARELSNIENGIHAPSLRTLAGLCSLYRVSPEQLHLEAITIIGKENP